MHLVSDSTIAILGTINNLTEQLEMTSRYIATVLNHSLQLAIGLSR